MIQRRVTKGGEVRWDVRLKRADRSEYAKTFRTKREAERYQAIQRADLARGAWLDPTAGRITFSAWAEEWYRSMVHTWRPRTADKHRMALRVHWVPRFGPRELASVGARDVQGAINDLVVSHQPASVRTYYGTLRSLFADAVDLDLIGRSPCRSIKLPRATADEKRVITPVELHRLADVIGLEWRCLVYLGGVMGLRFGEAVALRVVDVDLAGRRVSVTRTVTEISGRLEIGSPKTAASVRTLSIPARLVVELANHLERTGVSEPSELLFADGFGGPLRRSNFRQRVFDPAVRVAGLDGLTFHGLRHSAATQWVADGIDPRTAQHRLGHSDPRLILRLYAHASNSADEKAAEISDQSYWPV